MPDKMKDYLVGIWLLGIPVDWAYWIALSHVFKVEGFPIGVALMFGWVAGVFWPIHALVEIWNWVLV